MSLIRSMSRPSSRINIEPKSTHHEHPIVRAVQNTASSRTLTGSFFEPDCSSISWTPLAIISRG